MSTQQPPNVAAEALARRRALRVLGAIVAAAVVASLIMIFVWNNSGASTARAERNTGLGSTVGPPAIAASSSVAKSTPQPSTSPSAPATSPADTPPPATTAACPTVAPCVLDGDAGLAADALNAYRASHQLAPVTVTVSADAQSCSLTAGSGPSCPSSYFWEPISVLQGTALITKIAAKRSGSTWLLDAKATTFTVGWSYTPGATGKAGKVSGVLAKVG